MEVQKAHELGIAWRDVRIRTEKAIVGPDLWECYVPAFSTTPGGLRCSGEQELFQDHSVFECTRWRRRLASLQGDPLEIEPAN